MKDPLKRIALDTAKTYLGIDNRQPNLLRLVGLTLDDLFEPGPVWSRRFKSLEMLRATLRPHRATIVATTEIEQDPFGALSWLKEQGLQINRFGPSGTPWLEPEWEKCVTKPFRLAFELAHHCAYLHGAPKMLWDLRRDVHFLQAELDSLNAKLGTIEEHFWSQDPDIFDDVPF